MVPVASYRSMMGRIGLEIERDFAECAGGIGARGYHQVGQGVADRAAEIPGEAGDRDIVGSAGIDRNREAAGARDGGGRVKGPPKDKTRMASTATVRARRNSGKAIGVPDVSVEKGTFYIFVELYTVLWTVC